MIQTLCMVVFFDLSYGKRYGMEATKIYPIKTIAEVMTIPRFQVSRRIADLARRD
jgi:hypothetical protein